MNGGFFSRITIFIIFSDRLLTALLPAIDPAFLGEFFQETMITEQFRSAENFLGTGRRDEIS
jgi:hypothetical protein